SAVEGVQVFDEPCVAAAPDARVAAADGVLRHAKILVGGKGILRIAADHDFVMDRKDGRPAGAVTDHLEIRGRRAAGIGICWSLYHLTAFACSGRQAPETSR